MGKSILDTEACWLDNPEYMIYSSLLSFYIPAGVLTLVYVKIFRKIRVRQGIHAMLRAGGSACGTDVTPFHLPFVVVQEVSYEEQPSSTEKRFSDIALPAGADVTKPSRSLANNTDGLGYYQLVEVTEDDAENRPGRSMNQAVTSSVTKSKTFPTALAEEAETVLPWSDRYSRHKKQSRGRGSVATEFERANRSYTDDGLDVVAPESSVGKVQKRNIRTDDGVRLLCRTSSEKRLNEHKDRAVQTRLRRLSLWYHHSCQHIGTVTPNGNCIVIEDNGEEPVEPKPKQSPAATKRRIFSKALGSSVVSLKQVTRIQKKVRRTSSLEPNSPPAPISIPIIDTHLAIGQDLGVSVSTSMDFDSDMFGSRPRSSSAQAEDDEEEDHVTTVYTLPASVSKARPGFNLKKLASRVTNALHRITETQAVTKEKKATKLVALILGEYSLRSIT